MKTTLIPRITYSTGFNYHGMGEVRIRWNSHKAAVIESRGNGIIWFELLVDGKQRRVRSGMAFIQNSDGTYSPNPADDSFYYNLAHFVADACNVLGDEGREPKRMGYELINDAISEDEFPVLAVLLEKF